jgi:glyoxylase-like metal-dependent hydrolase (beta-lactamase superfamily II)
LNHASVRIDAGPVRLLSDPWLEGTAFSGGWGLRWESTGALERAIESTHLWISHWHSDHLSPPSLRRIAAVRPDLVVLANVSANFSMIPRLRELGFRDVRALGEREPFPLPGGQEVVRYPTAGIDNMLLLTGPYGSVLNLNDCNLPARALRMLRRDLGPIDLLLNNYNHAGKLFYPVPAPQQKDELWHVFGAVRDILSPRFVVPFASSHFYRVAESMDQNASLLTVEELEARAAGDPGVVVLRVGDSAQLDARGARIRRADPPARRTREDVFDPGASIAFEEVRAGADRRCRSLAARFPGAALVVPPLAIELRDLGRTLELTLRHGAREAAPGVRATVRAHSRAIQDWLERRFGDDTFVAGAHFGLVGDDPTAIRRWALLTLLDASHLAPADLPGYLRSAEGRHFLWSRREEVFATLVDRRFRAGEMRL